MVIGRTSPKAPMRAWSVRSAATGALLATVRARLSAQAAELAAGLVRFGAYTVTPHLPGRRRGQTVDPMHLHAVHEAAHAIVARELCIGVDHVTLIDERGDGAGGTCVVDVPTWLLRHLRPPKGRRRPVPVHGHEPRSEERRALVRDHAVQSVAGLVAESLMVVHPPDRSDGPGSDLHDARVLARLLGHRGQSIASFLREVQIEAAAIVYANIGEVRALARELVARWVSRRLGPTDINRTIRAARHSSEARRPAAAVRSSRTASRSRR